MRKWIPVGLIVLTFGWYVMTNVGSSMALSDAAARPVLALTRDGTRIPIRQLQAADVPDAAHMVGGSGIQFGYSLVFKLPDTTLVTCNHRFRNVTCNDGWQAER